MHGPRSAEKSAPSTRLMMRRQSCLCGLRLIPLALSLSLVAIASSATLHAQYRVTQTSTARAGREEGFASFYSSRHNGRRTASGERFDNAALVAAHPTLPFGTRLTVTNLENNRSVEVRVIDRGPSAARQRDGYVIDLSRAAATSLGFVKQGRARVRLDVIGGSDAKR